MTQSSHSLVAAKEPAATKARNFRTFLLMQQFANREIGERVARARRESGGMTQEQLAELLNVSKRSVQDYEAGVTVPWKHMQTLSQTFKRSIEWFLHGEESGDGETESMVLAEVRRIHDRLDEIEKHLSR